MSRPTGRPAVPTELKVLRGNPGRRPLAGKARGEIPGSIPPPPDHLRDAGRREWDLYWTHGRVWLAYTDLPILTQLCEAQDEAFDLRAKIMAEGLTQVSKTTGRSFVHQSYNDLRGLRREIRELWQLTYMTPTDRGRANVKVDEADPFAEWAAK